MCGLEKNEGTVLIMGGYKNEGRDLGLVKKERVSGQSADMSIIARSGSVKDKFHRTCCDMESSKAGEKQEASKEGLFKASGVLSQLKESLGNPHTVVLCVRMNKVLSII